MDILLPSSYTASLPQHTSTAYLYVTGLPQELLFLSLLSSSSPLSLSSSSTIYFAAESLHTVGAKSITRYDINGHNISKFFSLFSFFLFLFSTECKNNKFKIKIEIFFVENMLRPTQKSYFFAAIFSSLFNFQGCQFVIEKSLHTQNYQSFFRWGYGELFWRYFCLKCQDFP
jgi:hypothetical protein